MGRQKGTEGVSRSETVVSVRFSSDEIARLKQLAERRNLPLSTVIRRASLAAFSSPPLVLMPSINRSAEASGWISYDSRTAQVRAGSTSHPQAAVVTYRTSAT
jgi:predicted transcriptional regulator